MDISGIEVFKILNNMSQYQFLPFEELPKHIDYIFLIDDDEDDLDLFAEALETLKLPIEYKGFKNGEEFLNYVQNIDTSKRVKVFLDLNMPIISGVEVLKKVKSDSITGNIWITIYSTSASPKDLEETFTFGANSYLQKPTSFEDLKRYILKSLERFITKHQSKCLNSYLINS